MNSVGLIFALIGSTFILILPKHLVLFPLLMGCLYLTRDSVLDLGPAHFTLVQILVLVGLLRTMLNGERITGGINNIDKILIIWSIWFVVSCIFHQYDSIIGRCGTVLIHLGCYFLFRILIQDMEDIQRIFKGLCFILLPVAVLMLLEKNTGKNFYGIFEGITERVDFRHGHFRARGPFAHAILAGTVGATCLPMVFYLWKKNKKHAVVGLFSTISIVLASTASGPIMMVLFTLFGLMLWKVRGQLQLIRWFALSIVIILNTVMKDPVYFLMARIDISGGSQGWFRARLIQSSIEHLGEWWFAGTDYTRHWMPSGITANPMVTDITNHFLWNGVMGGLPLMFIFIFLVVAAFAAVGRALKENTASSQENCFLIWILGSILFGHVWNFFAIVLFDQSIVFFYLIIASINTAQVVKSIANIPSNIPSQRIRQSRYITTGIT